MSDIRWIKVAVDMFEDSKIEFIRSLPEGDAIIVTWIQMLSIAGQSNMGGYLMVAEGIPYTEQLLSNKLRRQPVLLQFALETLSKLKMIDIEDGPYHITKWEKHQNVEGMEKVRIQTNERVKKHRLKEKGMIETLPSNATVTLQVTQCNAIELELDLELEKEKIKTSSGSSMIGNNPFSLYEKQGFGKIDETTAIFVGDTIDTYGEDLTRRAMVEAVKHNKKVWSYVEGILKRWKATGHPEPWTLEREEPKQQQRFNGYGRQQSPRMEVVKDTGPAKEITPEEREKHRELARKLRDGEPA